MSRVGSRGRHPKCRNFFSTQGSMKGAWGRACVEIHIINIVVSTSRKQKPRSGMPEWRVPSLVHLGKLH